MCGKVGSLFWWAFGMLVVAMLVLAFLGGAYAERDGLLMWWVVRVTPTWTPAPTWTLAPTWTPAPTWTLAPTSTPAATWTPIATPTPAATATLGPPAYRWDQRLSEHRVYIVSQADDAYELVAAWMTFDGSAAPAWAAEYMTFAEAGADHHVLGMVVGLPVKVFEFSYPGTEEARPAEASGWANWPLYAKYDPAKAAGPYCFGPRRGWRLCGMGLPWGQHVSFLGVWRAVGGGSQ